MHRRWPPRLHSHGDGILSGFLLDFTVFRLHGVYALCALSTLPVMIIEGMKPPGSITIRIAMVRMSRVIMTEHVGRNNRRALCRMLITIPKRIFITPGPIFRIHIPPHQTVKDRIRPIPYLGHQTVFFRIDMYIIHMGPVILFIGYEMLPIPSLPDASLPPCCLTRDRHSVTGNAFEKPILINRKNKAKLESPGGSSHTQCICSNNTTQPWIRNG